MPSVSWLAKRAADVALRNGLVQGDGGYVHFRAILDGDFKHFLFWTPICGRFPFWPNIFQRGWNHQIFCLWILKLSNIISSTETNTQLAEYLAFGLNISTVQFFKQVPMKMAFGKRTVFFSRIYQIWAPGEENNSFDHRLWCYHQCMSSTVAFDSFLVALGGSRRNSTRQRGNGSTPILTYIVGGELL